MRARRDVVSFCFVGLLLPLGMAATAMDGKPDTTPAASFGQNLKQMQFAPIPGMPTCAVGSVRSGDPSSGASVMAAKARTGCVFPWHWHTPNEHLMLVSGIAKLEMRDGATFMLHAGGYALMPSKHVHRFTCVKACVLFVHSDAAFDMHYVNGEGHEIAPDEAMRNYAQTAAPAPK